MASAEQFRGVVAHLLADAEASRQLLGLEDTAAFITMEDSSVAVVIHPTKRGEALQDALERHLRANPRVHHKLIMIGGDAQMQTILAACQPGTFSRRMVQVYQLLDDGTVWSGRASRLDSPTGRALQAVASMQAPPAPSVEELASQIRRPTHEEREAHVARQAFVRGYRAGRPLWTYGAVAFLLGVYGLQLTWGASAYIPSLIRMGANTDAALGPEPWRLLSGVALHGGWLHIGANAFMLFVLGGHLERILGWARLTLLLVVSALAGSLLSALFRDALLSVGASGAIFGTLGAAAMVAWRPAGLVPAEVAHQLRRAAFLNLALNVGVSMLPGVDFLAHLGGGLAGVALVGTGVLTRGLAPVGGRTGAVDTPVGLRVSAVVAAASVVVALGIACLQGRPWIFAGTVNTHRVPVGETALTLEVPTTVSQFVRADSTEPSVALEAGDPNEEPYLVSVVFTPIDDLFPLAAGEREAFVTQTRPPDEGAMVGPRKMLGEGDVVGFEEVHTYPNGARVIFRSALLPIGRVDLAVSVFADAPPGVWSAARGTAASLEGPGLQAEGLRERRDHADAEAPEPPR